MNERPILMSGDNPKLILERRKTQTRRIADVRGADRVLYIENAQLVPARKGDNGYTGWVAEVDALGGKNGLHLPLTCPYGVAGDRLWVRETWRPLPYKAKQGGKNAVIKLRADDSEFEVETPAIIKCEQMHKWRPSIHMPRWASRITLEILKVRVERLQDIGPNDVIDEGIDYNKHRCGCEVCGLTNQICTATSSSLIMEYAELWDSLHGKGAWDKNPWVWVIEFRKRSITDSPRPTTRTLARLNPKPPNEMTRSRLQRI